MANKLLSDPVCLPDCRRRKYRASESWPMAVFLMACAAVVWWLVSGCAALYPEPTPETCATHYGTVIDSEPLGCPTLPDGRVAVETRSWSEIQAMCRTSEDDSTQYWGCVIEHDGQWAAYAVPKAGPWVRNHERCHCLGKLADRAPSLDSDWWRE